MNEQEREAIIRENAKKTIRYHMPGMDAVVVRDTAYDAGGSEIPMAIYYPSAPAAGARLPVAIVAFGYADPEARVRQYGPMTSWPRLIAASGMAAVLYGTNEPATNIHAVLKHVRGHAAALGLDDQRIGLFASSGNVPVALATLMRDRALACAALLYGYTMDLDGSTAVADVAREHFFADACAGKSVDDLPDTVPMLFVRAGREQFPGLNEALDNVVSRSIARNLPVTLVNYPSGVHGFELEEDTEMSRGIIQQVLAFLRWHLGVV